MTTGGPPIENIPPIIPERIPAISPAYQVGFIFILSEKKKKYRLSKSKAMPRSSDNISELCPLMNSTDAYVETRQPIAGNQMFFQWILRNIKIATKRAERALSIEERTFASVYESRFGKKIIAKIPKPKPVAPCM